MKNKKKKSDLLIVIVTNKPNDERLSLLQQTILNSGFEEKDIKVLMTPPKFSWYERLNVWKNFYQQIPPDQIVLSLDAFDVLMIGHKKEIIDKFNSFHCSLVFGWANYCWPPDCPTCHKISDTYKFLNPYTDSYCYLCAGAYIGRAGYLAKLLHQHAYETNVDDQCYFSKIYDQSKDNQIKLDFKNKIFQNTTPNDWNDGKIIASPDKSERLYHIKLKEKPNVFHFDSYHYTHKDLNLCYNMMRKLYIP
jgi:hypothetical protein